MCGFETAVKYAAEKSFVSRTLLEVLKPVEQHLRVYKTMVFFGGFLFVDRLTRLNRGIDDQIIQITNENVLLSFICLP